MSQTSVYLLAAGRGRRAGGPKAWRPWEGRTLLEAQLEFLAAIAAPERTFVSIQAEWRTRCRALAPRARWVAVDPDAPALASLQALLRESGAAAGYVLHVDMPVFDRAVWSALAAAGGDAVPVLGGRRGHPVLLSAATLGSALRLDPARDRLDVFLRTRPVAVVSVAVESVLANLNGAPA